MTPTAPHRNLAAVILAAGLGSRLREAHADPKGLLEIGGDALLARSLSLALAAGIGRIVVVVGWRAERYEAFLARRFPQARMVRNPDFATTGSLRSLALAAAEAPEGALILESDLIFEARALEAALDRPEADGIVVSGFTGNSDEVWAYDDGRGRLAELSKARRPGRTPAGEFTGLSRVSGPFLRRLEEQAGKLPPSAHYEDGFNALCPDSPAALWPVPDLVWGEVDDPGQLERARRSIWPRIQAADAARAGAPASLPPASLPASPPRPEARPPAPFRQPARKILLNPGPGTTSDAVKQALVVADICPREPEFGAVVSAVRRKLLAVAGAAESSHAAILLSGPGTAAMEAALGSLVPAAGRALILDNGAYGARAGEIAAALGVAAHVWRVPWTESPSEDAFAAALDGPGGPFTHAFWVHLETTTGLLNPLGGYGAACRRRGVTSLVDTMSSFAGIPLSLADEPIDFVLSSANKCLQGMAGISFVIGRTEALQACSDPGRGYALNLLRHWRAESKDGQFPFTPPVQVLYALDRAIDETLAETVEARAARYRACYEVMLGGMEAMGFEALLPRALHSGLLTTFREPRWPGFSFDSYHDHLYRRGITLYPGKISGASTFRVANIGDLRPDDLRSFLAATADYLRALGRP